MGRNWTRKSIEEIFFQMFRKYGAKTSQFTVRSYGYVSSANEAYRSTSGVNRPFLECVLQASDTSLANGDVLIRVGLNYSTTDKYLNAVSHNLHYLYPITLVGISSIGADYQTERAALNYLYFIDATTHVCYRLTRTHGLPLELSSYSSAHNYAIDTTPGYGDMGTQTGKFRALCIPWSQYSIEIQAVDTALLNAGVTGLGQFYGSSRARTEDELRTEGATSFVDITY